MLRIGTGYNSERCQRFDMTTGDFLWVYDGCTSTCDSGYIALDASVSGRQNTGAARNIGPGGTPLKPINTERTINGNERSPPTNLIPENHPVYGSNNLDDLKWCYGPQGGAGCDWDSCIFDEDCVSGHLRISIWVVYTSKPREHWHGTEVTTPIAIVLTITTKFVRGYRWSCDGRVPRAVVTLNCVCPTKL